MSLICFSGDWHLKGAQLTQKLNVIREMMRICKERGVVHVFNGGDTFDVGEVGDRNVLPEVVIKGLTDIWNEFPIPSTYLTGNHDLHTRGSGLDFLHHSAITVEKEYSYRVFPALDLQIFYIPWKDNNKEYYSQVIDKLNSGVAICRNRIVLGHLSIIGSSLGKHGYCSAEHYYSYGLPDLLKTNFQPTRMFFSHIHQREDLGNGAMFLGALTQLRFDEDEGKLAGFHLLDTETGELEFVNLDYCSYRFFTIKEEELGNYDTSRDFVRFHTDHPEKYDHLKPNVRAIRNKLAREYKPEDKAVYSDFSSNQLDVNNLITKYCEIKSLVEPTSAFYFGEKKNLNLTLANKMTGLDFIHNVTLRGVGVHKNITVEFNKGFNTICGSNGSGKTSLLNGIIGALYENVPERGNIKNMMDKGGYIEVNLSAKGSDYCVTKSMGNKRFVSGINDTEYTLVSNFKSAIEPIFGDANTFTKLVYMDQNNTYDLVTTADSKRLEVLRKLLDLDAFESKQEEYKKEMKESQVLLVKLSALDSEITQLEKELVSNYMQDIAPFSSTALYNYQLKLRDMKAANKAYQENIIAAKQLNDIEDFEDMNDVQEFWAKEKRLKVVKEELTLAKGWEDVGCKGNPLPCMFLKNKAQMKGNIEELEAEQDFIQDFLKSSSWANYKHLKYSVKPEPLNLLSYTDEEMDNIQELITEQERFKATFEANQAMTKAYEAHKKRLASKQAERGSESLQELEDKIGDLRFLADLCGKNGLSLLVIDLVKTELQNIIDELIEFSELDLIIELSTNKKDDLDSFQILFGEKKIDVSKASGGEIALVRLIFKLALMTYLNRYFGAYKVLLIDEGGAALDLENTQAVINIIRKLCKEFNQIIYISHSEVMLRAADHVIKL